MKFSYCFNQFLLFGIVLRSQKNGVYPGIYVGFKLQLFVGSNGFMFRFVVVNQIVDSPHKFVANLGCTIAFFIPKPCGNKYIRMFDNFFEVDGLEN